MKTLGQLIREYRKAQHLTQGELAEVLDTTDQAISKYEKGIVTNIPIEKLVMLKCYLQIPFEQLPPDIQDKLSGHAYMLLGKTSSTNTDKAKLILSNYDYEYLLSTDYTPHGWQLIKAYAQAIKDTQPAPAPPTVPRTPSVKRMIEDETRQALAEYNTAIDNLFAPNKKDLPKEDKPI